MVSPVCGFLCVSVAVQPGEMKLHISHTCAVLALLNIEENKTLNLNWYNVKYDRYKEQLMRVKLTSLNH